MPDPQRMAVSVQMVLPPKGVETGPVAAERPAQIIPGQLPPPPPFPGPPPSLVCPKAPSTLGSDKHIGLESCQRKMATGRVMMAQDLLPPSEEDGNR